MFIYNKRDAYPACNKQEVHEQTETARADPGKPP